jgi:hypothetical protein
LRVSGGSAEPGYGDGERRAENLLVHHGFLKSLVERTANTGG